MLIFSHVSVLGFKVVRNDATFEKELYDEQVHKGDSMADIGTRDMLGTRMLTEMDGLQAYAAGRSDNTTLFEDEDPESEDPKFTVEWSNSLNGERLIGDPAKAGAVANQDTSGLV